MASVPIDQPEVWGPVQPETPSVDSPNPSQSFPAGSKLIVSPIFKKHGLLLKQGNVKLQVALLRCIAYYTVMKTDILAELCIGIPAFRIDKEIMLSPWGKKSLSHWDEESGLALQIEITQTIT